MQTRGEYLNYHKLHQAVSSASSAEIWHFVGNDMTLIITLFWVSELSHFCLNFYLFLFFLGLGLHSSRNIKGLTLFSMLLHRYVQ